MHAFDPATNRLTGISNGPPGYNFAYGYDSQGNITSRGSQRYVFDRGNRMTRATGKATYAYDGLGHRVSTVGTDGVNRVQVYSQEGQLLYAGPTGSTGTKYVYLHNHVIAEVGSGGTTYDHTDALGSPVGQSNASGQVINRTRYEPYGYAVAGAPKTIGFTGHVNDNDTGLVYMQQRYYDPIAGRMLSIDPVTTDANSGGSFNRYAYANNSPYRYIDPDGRNPAVLPAAGGTMVCGPICGGIAAGVVLIGGTYVAAKISNAIQNGKSDDAPKEARRPSRDVRAGADANATDSHGNLICVYCGEVMTTEPGHDNSREHDHVDPWADSHDSSAGNIVSGCKDCNRGSGGKGRKTPEQWGGKQGQFKDKPKPPPPPPPPEAPAK